MPLTLEKYNQLISSSEIKSPAGSSSPSKAPVVKASKFDTEVLNLMEQKGFDKTYEYDSRKLLENAYNGSYTSIKKKMYADGNKEVGNALASLETAAQKFKNELMKDQPDAKEIARLIKNSDMYASMVKKNFDNDARTAYKFDAETGKIKDVKNYYKDKETPERMDGSSQNAYAQKEGSGLFSNLYSTLETIYTGKKKDANQQLGLVNPDPVYKYLYDVDSRFKEKIKNAQKEKVQMWYERSLEQMNPENNHKSNINSKALAISEDMLKHVVNHGTVDSDRGIVTQDKAIAKKILNQLHSFNNPKEAYAYLNNPKTKEKLLDITNRLGYYGNQNLFNKYKDLNNDDDFVRNPENMVRYKKEVEGIEKTIEIYNGYREDSKDFKTNAVSKLAKQRNLNENLKSIPDTLYYASIRSAFDDRGNIVSFEKFKKNLVTDGKPILANPLTGQMIKQYGDAYMKALRETPEEVDNDFALKEHYHNITKGYKQVLNDTKVRYKHKNTMTELGLGNKTHEAIGYKSVNLSTDDLYNLKNFDGPKQQNVSNIWKTLLNRDGSFGDVSKAYILPANTEDERNIVSLLERKELSEYANKSDKTMKDFLKSAKDPSDVQLKFKKYSNIPGYSYYEFSDKGSGKSVVALINNNQLGSRGVKEEMYMNAYDTVEEEAFRIKGYMDLPERKNNKSKTIIQKPKLTWSNQYNSFIIDAMVPDRKVPGNYTKLVNPDDKPVVVPQGLTLTDAQDYAERLLNNLVNSVNY